MNDGVSSLFVAEMSAEVADEWINPDALDGLGFAMQSIKLATSLGIPEILPVGGLVTGAREARLLDECFKENRTVRVSRLPVMRQAFADQGEGTRGKVATPYPGQDEESRVVDDEVQVSRTLIVRPADELISRLGFPGAGAEAQQCDDLTRGAHEVAQLRARHELMTEVVITLDVGVPQQRVALCAHENDAEPRQIHRRNDRRLEHGAFDVGMRPINHRSCVPRRRQREEAVSLH